MHTRLPVVPLLAALAAVAAAVRAHPVDDFTVRFTRRQGNNYPPALQTPPQSSLPQAWVDALNAATSAGRIPNLPPSTVQQDGSITYPANGPSPEEICNWTLTKCTGANDVHQVPDGDWTVSFDDGPTAASNELYDFLHSHNQAGTHFMIGSQILVFQDQFRHAMQTGQQAAVHTWSHSLMSSKSNMDLLGELGWNMQIIYDLSGRIPTLWRPPQGDVDNRVRAIAEEVFGLKTVMWDAECNDWCIQPDGSTACLGRQPGNTLDSVNAAIQTSLNGPKSPGVIMLEHELNHYTINVFQQYYPTLAGLGWQARAVPDHFGWNWYANAVNNDDQPVNVTSIDKTTVAAALSANASHAEPTTAGTSSTASLTSTMISSTSLPTTQRTPSPSSPSRQSLSSNGAAPTTPATALLLSLAALVAIVL